MLQKKKKNLDTELTLITKINSKWIMVLNVKMQNYRGFPGGAVVENLPANAGDMGLSPGLGRSHMPRSK